MPRVAPPSTRIETREVHTGRILSLIDEATVIWSSGTRWGELVAERHRLDGFDTPELEIHSVIVHLGARTRVEQRVRETDRAFAFAPRQVRHGRKEVLVLTLSPALIERAAQQARVGPSRALREHPQLRAPQIEQLALLLEKEARLGFPLGRLYGESLGTALALHLLHQHSTAATPRLATGGIAPYRLRRVLEYVEANLDAELRLFELAAVAGLSTHRFAHNFKRVTGLAPHQYVIRERVERAKHLLRETDTSVTAITYSLGFGSPSRFALVFRRATGTTPSAYRACFR